MSDKNQSVKKTLEENKSRANKQFAATAVFLAVFYALSKSLPLDTTQLTSPTERLTYTIRWLFLSSTTIMFAMFGVLNVRGNTDAIDPLNGGSENLVELPNRILRNTTEQFILHASAVLTLSTFMDENSMRNIPLLVILFIIGRLFYAIGFSSAPMNRAFGFSITFIPTFATYAYCAYRVVSSFVF
ncbi:unnamed protein product [Mytilus edulis]|uniref:MAPEG family protein n=1 Tax=Mytilus edulis TaxID=6550 RepID=A0A8S3QDQ0_MYTED|nr:unnamed protein product [Mytilus edulis]